MKSQWGGTSTCKIAGESIIVGLLIDRGAVIETENGVDRGGFFWGDGIIGRNIDSVFVGVS